MLDSNIKPMGPVTIIGNIRTIIRAITSQIKNGIAALYICGMVVPLGATPFITKRLAPNGGDVVPVSL